MSATARVSASPSPRGFFRAAIGNLFQLLGFEASSKTPKGHDRNQVVRSSHSWGIFPAMPRDYIRRRRAIRRISNVIIVVLLSLVVAYAIVHMSGPAAFSAPHH
ncbi:MAG: hypothetical protein JSS69_00705 [Acidobacteria bacterium]|nr:hypothetical protein [Acidobacteriota bacterium]